MPRGRPSETWLGRDGVGPVHIVLVKLQSRMQVQIGQPGRGCVEWLGGADAIEAVLEFARPGQARILPWKPVGQRVTARHKELRTNLRDQAAEQEILALTERFVHVTVTKDGRIKLHPQTRDHLGILEGNEAHLYVVYFPSRLELWSRAFRLEMHDELADAIDPLLMDEE